MTFGQMVRATLAAFFLTALLLWALPAAVHAQRTIQMTSTGSTASMHWGEEVFLDAGVPGIFDIHWSTGIPPGCPTDGLQFGQDHGVQLFKLPSSGPASCVYTVSARWDYGGDPPKPRSVSTVKITATPRPYYPPPETVSALPFLDALWRVIGGW